MPITVNDVRLSYANLFQPKPPFNNPMGDPKYSVTILVPMRLLWKPLTRISPRLLKPV